MDRDAHAHALPHASGRTHIHAQMSTWRTWRTWKHGGWDGKMNSGPLVDFVACDLEISILDKRNAIQIQQFHAFPTV